MDQRLQAAIDAARAGEKRQAQSVLAEVLQDDPDQVHAWFLLSHLVDSPQQQTAYLARVLRLDPDHAHARHRLDHVRAGAAAAAAPGEANGVAVAADEMDFMQQAQGDTVPAWMAGDVSELPPPAPVAEAAPAVEEDLPAWLKQDAAADQETGTAAAGEPELDTRATLRVKTPAAQKPARQRQISRWDVVLAVLVILAVLVLVLLARNILAL